MIICVCSVEPKFTDATVECGFHSAKYAKEARKLRWGTRFPKLDGEHDQQQAAAAREANKDEERKAEVEQRRARQQRYGIVSTTQRLALSTLTSAHST